MAPTQPLATLADLPVEILWKIFDDYSNGLHLELFAVSLLSRHLHHTCLPLFLRRKGIIVDPQNSGQYDCSEINTTISWPAPGRPYSLYHKPRAADQYANGWIDVVSALRLALFIRSIGTLSIYFCSYGAFPYLDQNLSQTATVFRLTKLASKLSSIDRVQINFNQFEKSLFSDRDEDNATLFEDISQMLCALATKARHITISGNQLGRLVQLPRAGSSRVIAPSEKAAQKRFSLIQRPFLALKRRITPPVRMTELDLGFESVIPSRQCDGLPKETSIQSLTCCGTLLLVPPVLHSTLRIIQHGSLRSLTFKQTQFLASPRKTWNLVFSHILRVGQHIEEVKFDECILHPFYCYGFLSALPSLKRTSIIYDGRTLFSSKKRRTAATFKNLTHITSQAFVIQDLLSTKSLPASLRGICVLAEGNSLSVLVASLAGVHEELVAKTCPFPVNSTFEFSLVVKWVSSDNMVACLDNSIRGSKLIGAFAVITDLTVKTTWDNGLSSQYKERYKGTSWPYGFGVCLRQWVGDFPKLNKLTLELTDNGRVPRDVGTADLASALLEENPGLLNFTFNGVEYLRS